MYWKKQPVKNEEVTETKQGEIDSSENHKLEKNA